VKRKPLKVFEASPVTGNLEQLLDGRYGPYVTDGETNASLAKGTAPEELTLAAARAALGPSKKKRGSKASSSIVETSKTAANKRRASSAIAVKSSKKKASKS